jgi:hypothetical protein
MEGTNYRRKLILRNTPKARAGQAGRRREQWPVEEAVGMVKEEEGGQWGRVGQKGRMGRLAAGPVGPEAEKILSE